MPEGEIFTEVDVVLNLMSDSSTAGQEQQVQCVLQKTDCSVTHAQTRTRTPHGASLRMRYNLPAGKRTEKLCLTRIFFCILVEKWICINVNTFLGREPNAAKPMQSCGVMYLSWSWDPNPHPGPHHPRPSLTPDPFFLTPDGKYIVT